jgi:hypothetical protein
VNDPLAIACERLRAADPEAWEIFLASFEEYANEVTAKVISAPPEVIFQAQGRAQQCAILMRLFIESTAQ